MFVTVKAVKTEVPRAVLKQLLRKEFWDVLGAGKISGVEELVVISMCLKGRRDYI